MKNNKQSRQKEAMVLYKKGFSKNEIAEMLGINRSTVSRYFYSPTRAEVEDFYENSAYGMYYTKDGEEIPFNRRYNPLNDKSRRVDGIVKQEWYYNDGTPWPERFFNVRNRVVVYKTPTKK